MAIGAMPPSVVTLEGVGHRFEDGPWLFQNFSFSFRQGTIYALTGPSGSGKSTLLSLIAGWVRPSVGLVKYADDVGIRWVFQNPHGVRSRSALDHVVLPLLARGYRRAEANEEAMMLLRQVSLADAAQRSFSQLSGGEAQRLMLARGIASQPDVLLVDEPTAQLDFATGNTVNHALARLTAGSATIIVATHDERTVEACDEHVALDHFAPLSDSREVINADAEHS